MAELLKKNNMEHTGDSPGTGKQPMSIRVECYAGYRGEETPRRVWMGTRQIEVSKILDRWLSPDHRYFKILGDDDSVYILRHDIVSWNWELTFFQECASLKQSDRITLQK